jgi:hypothetical protein
MPMEVFGKLPSRLRQSGTKRLREHWCLRWADVGTSLSLSPVDIALTKSTWARGEATVYRAPGLRGRTGVVHLCRWRRERGDGSRAGCTPDLVLAPITQEAASNSLMRAHLFFCDMRHTHPTGSRIGSGRSICTTGFTSSFRQELHRCQH